MSLTKVWLEKKNLFFVLAALGLVLALFALSFHNHYDGDYRHDCSVCRFIQHLACIFVFLVVVLSARTARPFFPLTAKSIFSQLLVFHLQNRAPPVLS